MEKYLRMIFGKTLCNIHHIFSSYTGCKQRLMSISEQ